MKKSAARDIVVGMVVLLAALIFTIGIFTIGSERKIWTSKVGYNLRVKDANGLQSGSPVRLAGVQVGAVSGVHIPEDPNQTDIEVRIAVEQNQQQRIRQDTTANVRVLTLLGGEKYIELSPGSAALPALPPGAYIEVPESFGMEQFGEFSAGLADDIQSISNNVRVILETVQKQEGVVGRMLLDPNFGQQTFNDLSESARLTKEILQKVNGTEGLAGRLLNDREFGRQTTESIRDSLAKIEALVAKMTAENGVMSQAFDPNGKVASSIDNIHQASADLRDFTAEMKEGRGTLGRLLSDEEYSKDVLENIRKIAANLADISEKLNQGTGSAGALINDPQLYEDIENVLRGVKESKVMSGLIRHYRKKGEKAQEQDRGKTEEQPQEKGASDPNAPDGGR